MRAHAVAVLVTGVAAIGAAGSDERSHAQLVRAYVQSINAADRAALDELLAPDFVRYGPGTVVVRGAEGLRERHGAHRMAVPDFELTIEEMAVDGDTAWVTARYRGTNTGPGTHPPTGKRVEGAATSFFRIESGRIAEHHLDVNLLDVARQLGREPELPPAERGREICERIAQLYNGGDLAMADELFAPEHRFHGPADEGVALGPAGMKARVQRMRAVFTGLHITMSGIVAERDLVAIRFAVRGTHAGEFLGVPATNRTVEMRGMAMHRLADGKVAETWVEWDTGELLRQLGPVASRRPGAGRP